MCLLLTNATISLFDQKYNKTNSNFVKYFYGLK